MKFKHILGLLKNILVIFFFHFLIMNIFNIIMIIIEYHFLIKINVLLMKNKLKFQKKFNIQNKKVKILMIFYIKIMNKFNH